MRVLFLGAGASMDAGYPPAARLLEVLSEEMAGVVDVATKSAWQRFEDFRGSLDGRFGLLANSPNPEIVLTLPDLLAAGMNARDQDLHNRFDTAMGANDASGATAIAQEWKDPERDLLREGILARDALLRVLDWVFGRRHYQDAEAGAEHRRDYLRRELSLLTDGDVVLTTNWDTLTERILAEDGRWTPRDGYGFPVDLAPWPPSPFQSTPKLPEWMPSRSYITVLKLHGSFGWRHKRLLGPLLMERGTVYLDSDWLLSRLPIKVGSQTLRVRDLSEPTPRDYPNEPMMIYPSYLKQITGPQLRQVWFAAQTAVWRASHFDVIGASLPDADSAVRTLLNPVRFRLEDGSVAATISDPSKATRGRWAEYLGARAILRDRKAGEIT